MTTIAPSRTTINASKANRCPICNHPDWCKIAKDDTYVICQRVDSDSPANFGGGWYHRIGEREPKRQLAPLRKQKPTVSKVAETDTLHRVYSWLLKQCPVNESARAYLAGRGLNPDHFGSMAAGTKEHSRVWNGPNPEGVPGFFRKGGEWHVRIMSGILIPMHNIEGKIVGMQVRIERDGKKGYYWMASNPDATFGQTKFKPFADGGTVAVIQPHVINPKKNGTLIITEGPIKAAIIAKFYPEATILGVPGVSNWRGALPIILKLEPKKVISAFDMDRLKNNAVEHNLAQMEQELIRWEFTTERASWNPDFKGMDDALIADQAIKLETVYKSEVQTLEEIRRQYGELAQRVLTHPDSQLHIIKGDPGTGKTTSLINKINALYKEGWPTDPLTGKPIRICWLTDTKQQRDDVEAKLDFTPGRLEGRTPNQDSPFYCANFEVANFAGQQRHNVFQSVCHSCPYKDACGAFYYNASVQRVLSENFVLATKHSILNHSDRSTKFDVLIVDEGLWGWVGEQVEVSLNDINESLAILKTQPEHTDLVAELEALKGCIQAVGEDGLPLSGEMDINLDRMKLPNMSRPFRTGTGQPKYIKDFLRDLRDWPHTIKNHTLYIFKLHTKLMANLKGKTILNLDATPIMECLKNLNPVVHEFKARQFQQVTALKNVKLTKSQLASEEYDERLCAALHESIDAQPTVVMTNKAAAEKIKSMGLPSSTSIGWFGRDNRGLNTFQNYARLIQVGQYTTNPEALEYQVKAFQLAGWSIDFETIARQIRDAETLQSVGRLRGCTRSLDTQAEILILSRLVPAELKVDSYTTLEELAGSESLLVAHNRLAANKAEERIRQSIGEMLGNGMKVTLSSIQEYCGGKWEVIKKVWSSMTGSEPAQGNVWIHPNPLTSKVIYGEEVRLDHFRFHEEDFEVLIGIHGQDNPKVKSSWLLFVDALRVGLRGRNEIARVSGLGVNTVKKYLMMVSEWVRSKIASMQLELEAETYLSELPCSAAEYHAELSPPTDQADVPAWDLLTNAAEQERHAPTPSLRAYWAQRYYEIFAGLSEALISRLIGGGNVWAA